MTWNPHNYPPSTLRALKDAGRIGDDGRTPKEPAHQPRPQAREALRSLLDYCERLWGTYTMTDEDLRLLTIQGDDIEAHRANLALNGRVALKGGAA